MKIGIVTYHRSHNYGAMLQAVALHSVLTGLGHDVHFIDYWPKHQSDIYRLWNSYDFRTLNLKGKLSYFLYYIYTLLPKMLRKMHFNRFCKDFIIPYCSPVETEFDVIFYGSDQIWRKQYWGVGYNPVYFGKNEFKSKKHVSYAASMGPLPTAQEDIDTVIKYVSSLDMVSVRESSLKVFLESNGLRGIKQTLDPTLLLGRAKWEEIAKSKLQSDDSYLLLYDLQSNTFDRGQVTLFAQKHNLKVIEIVKGANKLPTSSKHTVDGPYEFLNDVKNASYVLTSSFHGLAFSIIFNKPFYASFRENGGRAESLLNRLAIKDRLLPYGKKLEDTANNIDWDVVNSKLNDEAKESMSFIRDAIRL